MFELVNSTTNTFDPDEDMKRRIRSHAMKDFRARQRKDRRGNGMGKNGSCATTKKPGRLTFKFVVESTDSSNDLDHEDRSIGGSTPLSITPSQWRTETPDMFQSPAQLQQIFGICRELCQWLRPDIKADFAGKPIDQAWNVAPCPMLLAANCLAAVGGLDAADRSRLSGLEVIFKGRVLHELQIRMQSPLAATTDETMSTLLFLVSYEFYRLKPEAVTHLRGLRSILRLKGQKRAGMRWGGGMVLETLDLLTALWQSADPLMMPVEDTDDSADPTVQTALQGKFHRAFAARGAFKQIADVLKSLDGFWKGGDDVSIDKFFESLNQFSASNCECESESETQSRQVARVVHQTFAISYNVIANRNPFIHHTNQCYVNGIVRTVASIDEQTWKSTPYLRYLALLTGASAARGPCDKTFFHTHLGKCQMVLGIAKWPEAKQFIVNSLRFRRGTEPKATKPDKRRTKHMDKLLAASGQDVFSAHERSDVVPVDDLLNYRSLSWHGERNNDGLEMLLRNDRTFHEAMLSGAFWKTE